MILSITGTIARFSGTNISQFHIGAPLRQQDLTHQQLLNLRFGKTYPLQVSKSILCLLITTETISFFFRKTVPAPFAFPHKRFGSPGHLPCRIAACFNIPPCRADSVLAKVPKVRASATFGLVLHALRIMGETRSVLCRFDSTKGC